MHPDMHAEQAIRSVRSSVIIISVRAQMREHGRRTRRADGKTLPAVRVDRPRRLGYWAHATVEVQ